MGNKESQLIKFKGYELLHTASAFHKTVKMLHEYELTSEIIAVEVNTCFACELYLKYIYYFIDNHNYDINNHKLYEIYALLSTNTQTLIKNRMDYSAEFENQLCCLSNNFAKLRYQHEFDEIHLLPSFAYELMLKLGEICDKNMIETT